MRHIVLWIDRSFNYLLLLLRFTFLLTFTGLIFSPKEQSGRSGYNGRTRACGNGCDTAVAPTFAHFAPTLCRKRRLRQTLHVGQLSRIVAQLIGQGKYPIWMADQSVIYVEAGQTLMQLNTDLLTVTPFADTATLTNTLITANPQTQIEFLADDPTHPDSVYLAIGDASSILGNNYLVRYNR